MELKGKEHEFMTYLCSYVQQVRPFCPYGIIPFLAYLLEQVHQVQAQESHQILPSNKSLQVKITQHAFSEAISLEKPGFFTYQIQLGTVWFS